MAKSRKPSAQPDPKIPYGPYRILAYIEAGDPAEGDCGEPVLGEFYALGEFEDYQEALALIQRLKAAAAEGVSDGN